MCTIEGNTGNIAATDTTRHIATTGFFHLLQAIFTRTIAGNRHDWLLPSVPGDVSRTVARNRHDWLLLSVPGDFTRTAVAGNRPDWLLPSVPGDFTRTVVGNRHYSTETTG